MYSKQNTVAFVASPGELTDAGLISTIKLLCKDNELTGKFFTVPDMSINKIYIFCAFADEMTKDTFINLLDSDISVYLDNDLTESDFTRLLS